MDRWREVGRWILAFLVVLLGALSCGGSGELDYSDVEAIFESKCVRCHSEPLDDSQAPFALVSYEDVYRHREEVERAVVSGAMPLLLSGASPPIEELSEEEKKDLLDWLRDGAPE